MSSYKVPQDVEADDKLLGPFSFRQFIYLMIVAAAIAIAWALSRIFIGLLIIPLPVILLFGTLALPLRKDQPMEIYLAAIISFYLKPHQRLWDPDGIESLIQITAPKTVEFQRTKDLTQEEAEQRLGYLANLVDTQGWAVRGSGLPIGSSMNDDVFMAAQQTEDVLDSGTSVSRTFDQMISNSDARHHQEVINRMKQPPATPQQVQPQPMQPVSQLAQQFQAPSPQPAQYYAPAAPVVPATNPSPFTVPSPQAAAFNDNNVHFDPYPSFNQTVIQPIDDPGHVSPTQVVANSTTVAVPEAQKPTATNTSTTEVSPDIMSLANNSDLSIETIAREANRIEHKDDPGEVYVSLR